MNLSIGKANAMRYAAIVLALAALTVSGAQAKSHHHRVVITKVVPVFGGPVIIQLPNGQPVGSWECYTEEAQGRFVSCDLGGG